MTPHPLRERLRGDLWNCGLHARLRSLSGPPFKPGRYRVHWDGTEALGWFPLSEVADSETGGR